MGDSDDLSDVAIGRLVADGKQFAYKRCLLIPGVL